MKKRQGITRKIRDGWVNHWETDNSKDNGYISFIKTQDIKSEGSKNRSPDFLNPNQDRNFLSINESLFYLQLLFDGRITWVKEQYPLLPIESAQYAAKMMGERYSTYPYSSNVPIVMTSDFYCGTIIPNKEVIYSVKDEKAFDDEDLKEEYIKNQKIEKAFWISKGVAWHLIRSADIKNDFSTNLEKIVVDLHLNRELSFVFSDWIKYARSQLTKYSDIAFVNLFDDTTSRFNVSYDQAISLFQHALWHKKITANLKKPLNYSHTLSDLGIAFND